jgi:4-hydroxybenzoate polyprenyltransferase
MALTKLYSKIREYGTLVMFQHTIFSLSFGLIAMFLAGDGQLSIGRIFLILIVLLSARTGANAINRVIDAEIDGKNHTLL